MNMWVQRTGLILDICGSLLLVAEGIQSQMFSKIDSDISNFEQERFGDWFKPAYDEQKKEVYLHKSIGVNLLLSPWSFWLCGCTLMHPLEFGKIIGSLLNIGPWQLRWVLIFAILPLITIVLYIVSIALFFIPINITLKNILLIPLCLWLMVPVVTVASVSISKSFRSKIQLIGVVCLLVGFVLQFIGTF